MELSIIIPVLNEIEFLPHLLKQLNSWNFKPEIIVVDGGSTDGTQELKGDFIMLHTAASRAIQMNEGAKRASHQHLMFLHADSKLSESVAHETLKFIQSDYSIANFKLRFDDTHWWLSSQAFFSKFKSTVFQFGDQALLIRKSLFDRLGGYDEQMLLLEDQDLIKRAKQDCKLHKLDAEIITSARKYRKYGRFKLQWTYYLIYFLYRMGASQETLMAKYKSLISETN